VPGISRENNRPIKEIDRALNVSCTIAGSAHLL
jgi:hypothetical protein